MPDHILRTESPLTPAAIAEIDAFGEENQHDAKALSVFLKEKFNFIIETDPDIVVGFARDSSNLKGAADGIARPSNARETALVLRACRASRIPITVSAGKSNLTGSATPWGEWCSQPSI